jgi:hypothetical protein
MMKKLLILMLVFGLASLANATVVDVVTVGLGDMGHAGTEEDPLEESEIIAIQIILNHNPYAGYPSYDGYFTDGVDLDLHVTGAGSLGVVQLLKKGIYYDDLQHHADFAVWAESDPLIVGNAIASMSGGVLTGGIHGAAGGTPLIWNLYIHCDGDGPVNIDLTLNDGRYAPYGDPAGDPFYADFDPRNGTWLAMVEADLGDLTIYQVPEPATIALLGLGSMFLMRRKRK